MKTSVSAAVARAERARDWPITPAAMDANATPSATRMWGSFWSRVMARRRAASTSTRWDALSVGAITRGTVWSGAVQGIWHKGPAGATPNGPPALLDSGETIQSA